jgi:hypothetical protein
MSTSMEHRQETVARTTRTMTCRSGNSGTYFVGHLRRTHASSSLNERIQMLQWQQVEKRKGRTCSCHDFKRMAHDAHVKPQESRYRKGARQAHPSMLIVSSVGSTWMRRGEQFTSKLLFVAHHAECHFAKMERSMAMVKAGPD